MAALRCGVPLSSVSNTPDKSRLVTAMTLELKRCQFSTKRTACQIAEVAAASFQAVRRNENASRRPAETQRVNETEQADSSYDAFRDLGGAGFCSTAGASRAIRKTMKIAALVSGGVDSSVAVHVLVRAGHRDVTAFYLKVWLEDELSHLGQCPWEEDLRYARAACEQVGVPLRVLSLQAEYFERVVQYALAELRAGRTPSPDLFCNQRIKFGIFWDRVGEPFEKVASGHYAQVREENGVFKLFRSPDAVKDQTYFLSRLSQAQLARILFPVGHLRKSEVRRMAHQWGLPNKDRPDSQGICFLGKVPYDQFVRHYLGEKHGDIIEVESGRRLGRHRGYWFYTIGQRSGLGLSGGPWYVVRKDVAANVVFVSHKLYRDARARDSFRVVEPNWIWRPLDDDEPGLSCKIRHGPTLIPCRVRRSGADGLLVTVSRPDPGVAPGQFCVFYRGDECLGSGRIES